MNPLARRIAAPRRSALLLALALVASLAWSAPAQAQEVVCAGTDDFPCSFQAEAVALQKVPAIFKFQSRVSQAKLPLGEAVFETVYVKLLRGSETLCTEQFSNVTVQNSVLNLEIGRNMSCELDEIIAENPSLAFQVCLGGQENCLRPLDLAASPYAIKSSFASQAQNAHQSDISGQAHYAHRVTADRDLLLRNTLGTGYFDFYTHPADAVDALYNAADYIEYANSGFIQWTPLASSGAFAVHIVAKDPQTDKLRMLDRFVVAANENILRGNLTVTERGIHVTGDSDITGDTTLEGLLLAGHDTANLLGFIDRLTHGIDGPLQVTGATTISSGGVHVIGDSDVQGSLAVGQLNPAFTLDVGGDINFTGQLRRNGQILAVDGAQWSGGANSSLYYTQGPVGVGTNAPTFPLDVEGDINFTGQLRRNGQTIPVSPWIDEGGRIAYPGQVTADRFIGGAGSTFDDLTVGADGTGFARGDVDLRGTGNQTGLRVFTGAGQAAAVFNDAGDLTTLGAGKFSAVQVGAQPTGLRAGTTNIRGTNFTGLQLVHNNTIAGVLQSNGDFATTGTAYFLGVNASSGTVTASSGNFSGITVSSLGASSISTSSFSASDYVNAGGGLIVGGGSGRARGGDSIVYTSGGGLFDGQSSEAGVLITRSLIVDDDGDLEVDDAVYADAFTTRSDRRLKTVLGRSDAAQDLNTLRAVQITDYKMRDQRKEPGRLFKMLIAQQVKEVFPQAVSTSVGAVPDIMSLANTQNLQGERLTISVAQEHTLRVGEKVLLQFTRDGKEDSQLVEVARVPNAWTFVVEGWTLGSPDDLLVYGRQVDDFMSVDYDAISMLNVSATQELARKVDNLESMRAEIATLRAENERLQRRFAELDQLREEIDAVRAACGGQDL